MLLPISLGIVPSVKLGFFVVIFIKTNVPLLSLALHRILIIPVRLGGGAHVSSARTRPGVGGVRIDPRSGRCYRNSRTNFAGTADRQYIQRGDERHARHIIHHRSFE